MADPYTRALLINADLAALDPSDIGRNVQPSVDGSDQLDRFAILSPSLVDGGFTILLSDYTEVLAVLGDLHSSDKVDLGGYDLDVVHLVTLLVQRDDGDSVSLGITSSLAVEIDLASVGDVQHSVVGRVEDDLARGHLGQKLVGDLVRGGLDSVGVECGGGATFGERDREDEDMVNELGDDVEVFA